MNCGACGQDRHPVIEGDQNGRFVYTCGNGECHAFIKLHERSEPAAAKPKEPAPVAAEVTWSEAAHFAPMPPPAPAPQTVDAAVSVLAARLVEVEALLSAGPALKAERSKLRRMLAAAAPKSVIPRPVVNGITGQILGYSADRKAHQ